ncbi:hypothetical protein ACFOTA_15465 [Chitinophaga sp. GCM10012297]|uniref:Uncharacterized protein n=1 Tax=Chitinophaga chungangae TaxID=2821488 RepID=A0ABS3YG34_9BACT|nr:hypothetical protein [Chitinophaga chungangae]MBO9153619.1 hypothetical protein [Chitinophaga chungangae]
MQKTGTIRHMAIIIVLSVVSMIAKGQNVKDRVFKFMTSRYQVSFSIPPDYVEADSGFRFVCSDSQLTNAIVYSIIRKDSSVKIGFSFVEVPDNKTYETLKLRYPGMSNHPPNKNYLRSALVKADTIGSAIKYYDDAYAKNAFNADHALSLSRACIVPYLIWNHNRIVHIAKDDRCHIEISYFFTEAASKTMYEEIERTEKMIRFD